MNILNSIFQKLHIEEFISHHFKMVKSSNIDYSQFLRDRLDYLYIEDWEIVLNAKDILLLMNDIEDLKDYSKNTSFTDIDSLEISTNQPYLLLRKEGKVIGIIDVKILDEMNRIFGNQINGVIRDILNASHDAICIVDKDKKVLLWNKKAEEIYGIPEEKIHGTHISELFPTALLPHVIDYGKSYEDVFNNPRDEFKNIITARPLYSHNEMIGAISCDKDISEMNENASKLKTSSDNSNSRSVYKKTFKDLIGEDRRFKEIIQFAQKISDSTINVLITGESGTGKEIFSQAIHNESGRNGPFVPVNCSAIPKDLIESELFGYEKGSFTGALSEGKIGKFELANKGTILLDEIGDLPLSMQPKILRILEDGIFYRVGGNTAIKIDVRIIASTNRDLKELIDNQLFRKDLFYRLNSVHIDIPPLRERVRDIPLLINYFIREFALNYKMNIFEMPMDMVDQLTHYTWEGNIRELKNIIERYVIMRKNGISHSDFPTLTSLDSIEVNDEEGLDLNRQLKRLEEKLIQRALKETGMNQSKAAKLLGIPRTTLLSKLERYKK